MKFLSSDFEDYHRGSVNLLLHNVGFALWGLGVGLGNAPLIILSPLVFESGHVYNYISGRRTKNDLKKIPGQILIWIVFASFGIFLSQVIR